MQIDWFTFGAQIVNFLILLALLKYFLYDRIIDAMDERKKTIALQIEEAENKKQEAEQERSSLQEKQKELESDRKKILDRAKKEAEEQREKLVRDAKADVQSLRERWHASVQEERDSFLRELRQQTAQEVYHIVRRVLNDLADADVHEQTTELFMERIRSGGTNGEGLDVKEVAAHEQVDAVTVRSSFDLSSGQRQKLTRIVHEVLGKEIAVDYETESSLIFGISMQVGSSRLEWNAEDYLESLEEKTDAMLKDLESRKDAQQQRKNDQNKEHTDEKHSEEQ